VVLVLHLSRNPGFDSRGQYPEIKIFPDFITNDQHKSIIGALRAAALNWEYGRLTLWWVTTDGLLKATFYTKLKKLHVKEGKQINFVVGNHRWVAESNFLHQAQKTSCKRRKERQTLR